MANNPKLSVVARNAMLNGVGLGPLLNGGTIDVYDGSQPTDPDTAVTTQTKLATLTFSATAFAAASAGSDAANAITSGTGLAASNATWARLKSSGGTPHIDCTVGTSGCDINLNTVAITIGISVACTGLTITKPNP